MSANTNGDKGPSGTHPGDDLEPGTPGTGENLCRTCQGTGKVEGQDCPECDGTGKVTEGVGGA